MKKIVLLFLLFTFLSCTNSDEKESTKKLLIYAGAASKPPTEEIIRDFKKATGVDIEVIFGGSGFVLSQMKLSGKGDIYFPGSSDYMEIAKNQNLVFPESEKKIVYLVNSINVQKGNPLNIKSIKDLCKPGIKLAIGNPEGVCVGSYAVEIIENKFSKNEITQFRNNLSNYTESCDKTASAVALKAVDAIIGWNVFQYWNPEMIESIPLNKDEIIRIGYIPIAVSTLTDNKELANKFIKYVLSSKGQEIFKKYHYFSTLKEVEEFIGTDKPVGGEYKVPNNWLSK